MVCLPLLIPLVDGEYHSLLGLEKEFWLNKLNLKYFMGLLVPPYTHVLMSKCIKIFIINSNYQVKMLPLLHTFRLKMNHFDPLKLLDCVNGEFKSEAVEPREISSYSETKFSFS